MLKTDPRVYLSLGGLKKIAHFDATAPAIYNALICNAFLGFGFSHQDPIDTQTLKFSVFT